MSNVPPTGTSDHADGEVHDVAHEANQ